MLAGTARAPTKPADGVVEMIREVKERPRCLTRAVAREAFSRVMADASLVSVADAS